MSAPEQKSNRRLQFILGGGLIVASILIVVAWALFERDRMSTRIERLAGLPPCRLAVEYMTWRIDFEERNPGDEIEGAAFAAFVGESEIFERAARRAQGRAQDRLLQELERVTTVDSKLFVYDTADPEPLIDLMALKCPSELELAWRGTKR